MTIVAYDRRSRPIATPRSSQRTHHNRYRTCTCAPCRVRKDTAAKRAERLRQSRTRAATRHNHHTLRARLPATAQIAKSRLGLVDAKPSIAHDDGSDHTDDCKRLATSWPRCWPAGHQAAAATICSRSSETLWQRRAWLSGCQLQQQSQGVFEMNEMRTRGAPKVRGGRRT